MWVVLFQGYNLVGLILHQQHFHQHKGNLIYYDHNTDCYNDDTCFLESLSGLLLNFHTQMYALITHQKYRMHASVKQASCYVWQWHLQSNFKFSKIQANQELRCVVTYVVKMRIIMWHFKHNPVWTELLPSDTCP